MKKTGYDQFFQKAQKQSLGGAAVPRPQVKRAGPPPMKMSKKKKSVFPMKLIIFSGFGFSLALGGFAYVDQIELYLKRVNFSFLGQAMAEEAAGKKEDAKPFTTADAKAEVKAEVAAEGANLDHLQKLVDRQKDLEAKEEELKKVEEELTVQRQELEKKLKDLENVRGEISNVLNDRVQADSAKVDNLVQLYTNMRPQQASRVFETLDEDLTVEILGRMKKKNAAEIMNLMKPEKAQVISEKLAGYKRTPASKQNSDVSKAPASEETPAEAVPETPVESEPVAPSKAPVEKKKT